MTSECPELGDYFPFNVIEIAHREGSLPEVALDRLPPEEVNVAAFEDDELNEYISSYETEGWRLVSKRRRT
jgi:hypothetical protein